MTYLAKNDDDVRRFLGLPIEGDRGYVTRNRVYIPRPIEDLREYLMEAWDQGILAITWNQYTPRFNDGDICEFGVNDVSVTSDPKVAEDWLNGDFYEEYTREVTEEEYLEETTNTRWHTGYYKEEEDGQPTRYFRGLEEGTYSFYLGSNHPDGLNSDDVNLHLNDIEFEDALKQVFGDGTQVVISPTRVVQFEYDHE